MRGVPIKWVIFLLFCCATVAHGQEMPPVQYFSTNQYGGGNQNWAISQGADKNIYFANNEGVLSYNGATWNLFPNPNESITRSVLAVGDRVYSGSYMDFGYWQRDERNQLIYRSLSQKIESEIIQDEQFWGIFNFQDRIIFQSFHKFIIYDPTEETFDYIIPEGGITKVFQTEQSLFYQSIGQGFIEIVNGTTELRSSDARLKSEAIVNVFSYQGKTTIVTEKNGLYALNGKEIAPLPIDALRNTVVFSACRLKNGHIALGTISKGLLVLNEKGAVELNLNYENGLGNNTVLSVFEDANSNIWLGLDNGISCVNLSSPVEIFVDKRGVLGTVYTSVFYKDKLYLGSNQGLFVLDDSTEKVFKPVKGTEGQVLSLYVYDDMLFCGHHKGTFIIENKVAQQIYGGGGTWTFSPHPSQKDILFQGNYGGISLLQKKGNTWTYKRKIDGFNISSRYFDFLNDSVLYVSHEYKGIYKLKLDLETDAFTAQEKLSFPQKGKNAGLAKFNSTLYYANKSGIYSIEDGETAFTKDTFLSQYVAEGQYISGKMINDQKGKLWFFTKDNISALSVGKITAEPTVEQIPFPTYIRNALTGYENLNNIGQGQLLVGSARGFLLIKDTDYSFEDISVNITDVEMSTKQGAFQKIDLQNTAEFEHKENNVNFYFAVPSYQKFFVTYYRYRLLGFKDAWSGWTNKPYAQFENLPPAEYRLEVQAKIGNTTSEETAEYAFNILKPWYLKTGMLVLYFLIFLVLSYLVNKAYKAYYKKQKEQLVLENKKQLAIKELEQEKALSEIRNDQLKKDVASKNRELAASTMNLVNKNELLLRIKGQLQADENTKANIKKVVNIINQNINQNDNWNFFKEAFENADQVFFKTLKNKHPELTNNDIKLCAYLRLNLTSKEIAPLLGISVRSVEIKRYRLRKKMNLETTVNLTEYILAL